jgi:hypothetical protein
MNYVLGSVCHACESPNSVGRRFCGACGAALGVPCSRCAFTNTISDRFCGGCGHAVREEEPPVPVEKAPRVPLTSILVPARGSAKAAAAPQVRLSQSQIDDLYGRRDE